MIQVCDLAAGYIRRGSDAHSLIWLAAIRSEARQIRDREQIRQGHTNSG